MSHVVTLHMTDGSTVSLAGQTDAQVQNLAYYASQAWDGANTNAGYGAYQASPTTCVNLSLVMHYTVS